MRRKTGGGVETHVESLSSEYLHCRPVARITRPAWWDTMKPDWGMALEIPGLAFYFPAKAEQEPQGGGLSFSKILKKERMCHIALATYHAARRYNRLYFLTNDTIACIREECYSLPEIRETMPDGTERNVP